MTNLYCFDGYRQNIDMSITCLLWKLWFDGYLKPEPTFSLVDYDNNSAWFRGNVYIWGKYYTIVIIPTTWPFYIWMLFKDTLKNFKLIWQLSVLWVRKPTCPEATSLYSQTFYTSDQQISPPVQKLYNAYCHSPKSLKNSTQILHTT